MSAFASNPDDDIYYSALVAHDARFDGRVFVGVTSTGVTAGPSWRPVFLSLTPRWSWQSLET